MEYRLLGLSGCAVSALALGTLTFGNETGETDAFAQLDRFASAGGTLIDTADVYADGRSEQIIGRWLGRRADARELAVIATKGRFPTSDDPNGHGLSRRHLAVALDASLRRLGVEAIDLHQLHGWDPVTRSRRRCGSSTTRHRRDRFATSAYRTSWPTRSRSMSTWPARMG